MNIFATFTLTVVFLTPLDAEFKDGVMFGSHLRVVFSHVNELKLIEHIFNGYLKRLVLLQNPPYDTITRYQNGTVNFKGTGSLLADWWSRRFKLT